MSSQHLLQSSSLLTQYLGMARMSGISIWRMYLGMAMMSGYFITSKQWVSPPSSCQLSPSSDLPINQMNSPSMQPSPASQQKASSVTKTEQLRAQSQQLSPAVQTSSPQNQMDFQQKPSSVTETEQSEVGSLQSSPTIKDVCDSLKPQKMLFCHCHYERGIEGFGVSDTMDYESFISEVCERLEITDRVGLTIKYTVGNGKRPPSTMRNEGDFKTFLHFNKDEADIFVFKNDLKRPRPESLNANEEHPNKRNRH